MCKNVHLLVALLNVNICVTSYTNLYFKYVLPVFVLNGHVFGLEIEIFHD